MPGLDSFQFSFYAIPNILVSTLIFAAGFFVFIQNIKRASNIFFFLFCLSLNFWLYGRALMYLSVEAEQALWIARRFAKLGVAFISPLVYAFSVFWLNRYERQKKFVILGLVLSALFYLAFNFTEYGIHHVKKHFWGFYPVYGWVGYLYLGLFFSYFAAAFYNFFSELKVVEDVSRKKQLKIMTLAFLIACSASWDFIPKVFPISLYPFGFLMVLVWVLMVGYCIVKYRALDIQTVIHKTLIWLISTLIAMLPFVAVLYYAEDWMRSAPSILLTPGLLLFLVIFYFYFQLIQPKLGQLLKLRSANLDRTLETFSRRLTHLNNLSSLLQRFVRTLRRKVYVEKVSVFLLNSEKTALIPAIVKGNRGLKPIELEAPYINWYEKKNMILVKDLILTDPRISLFQNKLREHLEELEAQVIVPFVLGGKLIGVAYLGSKENFKRFTSLEIGFLSDLRVPMTIALSNSMRLEDVSKLYKELQLLNEELEQRVDDRTKELVETQGQLIQAEKLATIGTMAGGIAHEINNPLTAVLANAQILKMSASADDLELIDMIEQGAKRCQSITQKLLKYARKDQLDNAESRVDLVSFKKISYSVVAFLKYQLEQDGLKLDVALGDDEAWVWGNSNEIEQVLTNLLINARDALKEKQGQGIITIRLVVTDNSCQLSIQDNGIGMIQQTINKIFDPFYTTKEIGSGTGLGLAVAQGIIEKHQGKITVQSEFGEGTTFMIEIPRGRVDAKNFNH